MTITLIKSLPGIVLLLCLPLAAMAAPSPDPPPIVITGQAAQPDLRLTLSTPRAKYAQGDPIPITLHYTYSGTRPLAVLVVTGDSSGRIQDFGFTATDALGRPVPDPTPFHGGIGGGPRGDTALTPDKPYQQTVTLNEWLRFDAPGTYTVTAHSTIVHTNDDGTGPYSNPDVPLDSAPLQIQITAPDQALRRARLARDEAEAGSPNPETRRAAIRDLRFLVDARAIPPLVGALDQSDNNTVSEAWFGLRAFPDLAPVKAALLQAINTPAHLILPTRQGYYLSLLTEADQRAEGKPENPLDAATSQPYQALLAAHLRQSLAILPPARAAEVTVEGMAMGGMVPSDAENWRRVLVNAPAMTKDYQDYAGSLLEENGHGRFRSLDPYLRHVATDTALSPGLRSGAFVALHALGDDSLRDLLVTDVISPNPVLSDMAHATLGTYKASVIGSGLLRLATAPDFDTRLSAAERLPRFGAAIPAAQLRALLTLDAADGRLVRDGILEALALKSPADALPVIARDVHDPKRPYSGVSDTPIRLLCRMDTPAARRLMDELFHSPNPRTRQTVAQALDQSAQEAHQGNGAAQVDATYQMPPNGPLAASYVPELRTLSRNDPDGAVRAAARQALTTITGIPAAGNGPAEDGG